MSTQYDFVVVGAGLVGLATTYRLLLEDPARKILVLEKDAAVASHQSTRNSGVIHAGIYYKPGSWKAKLCAEGRKSIVDFAREHDVSHSICGKLVVAITEDDEARLRTIATRGAENGIVADWLVAEQLKEREPYVTGIAGLWVKETGVIDFQGVAKALVNEIGKRGGEVRLSARLNGAELREGLWHLSGACGEVQAKYVINCAGLFCDRIAALLGETPKVQIVPFRGEYYILQEAARHLCKTLIYPVPDPAFPFLGVHFTRRFDDSVECGPNAVLALAREGYNWKTANPGDLFQMASYSGFRSLIGRHWRMGLSEIHRSLSKKAFLKALQRLVPEVKDSDLVSGGAGVRAQAVRPDGSLEEDFCFQQSARALHVLNAPSPAATSCLAIARMICEKIGK